MKKIFIVLSLSVIFTFLILNNSKASAQYYNFADRYGVNMIYKTLYLNDIVNQDFTFTGDWGDNTIDTFYFEYLPYEESLRELTFFWYYGGAAPYFMELYTPVTTLEYLNDRGIEPIDDIGWTLDESWLILIVNKDYLRDSFPIYYDDPEIPTEQAILLAIDDLTEAIRVDTWVVTETTSEYQTGYNTGYQHGFGAGFSAGWDAKEAEINAQLPLLLQAEYQNGYDTGYGVGYDEGLQVSQGEAYDKGYQDGANESFIASIENWLVPAIIIVMLLGGYFAIARRKQDGDI